MLLITLIFRGFRFQVSALPLAGKAANLIKKET